MSKMQKKGFTIIEVVLVLAIGGLIFLMGMMAFSYLSVTQRDSARRENVLAVIAAIKSYQTDHRGALPSGGEKGWEDALAPYLGSDFVDPDGSDYRYNILSCGSGEICAISNDFSHDLYIYTSSTCNGESVNHATNPKKVAVLYRLEASGTYCENT